VLEMVAAQSIKPVIDKVVPLTDAPEAERTLEERKVFGKILLRP